MYPLILVALLLLSVVGGALLVHRRRVTRFRQLLLALIVDTWRTEHKGISASELAATVETSHAMVVHHLCALEKRSVVKLNPAQLYSIHIGTREHETARDNRI